MTFSGWLPHRAAGTMGQFLRMSLLYNVNSGFVKCVVFFAIFNEIVKWACNFMRNGLSYRKQRGTSFIIDISNKGVPRFFWGTYFYAQARIRKFTAEAACGPRGGQGR